MDQELITLTRLMVIATFSASVMALFIALFGDNLKSSIFHPKLEILYKHEWPDVLNFSRTYNENEIASYYFRIRIKNKGSFAAENVEVVLSNLEKKVENKYERYESFVPLNLNWSFSGSISTIPTISPHMEKHCDLGYLPNPNQVEINELTTRETNDETFSNLNSYFIFILSFIIKPKIVQTYRLDPGSYRFDIMAAASNAKTQKQKFDLQINEKWFDEPKKMLSESIILKKLR